MIIDTHAHYDDESFGEDRAELLSSLKEHGIAAVVNSGASLAGCQRTLELTKQYPDVYGTIGIHPDEVGKLNEETFAQLREMCRQEKVLAVGEIGLDYYWDKEHHDVQKTWFIRQLQLARELGLPVVIHSRDAAADTMEILKEQGKDLVCDIHCYSYSVDQALEYTGMGYYLGIGGVVTFGNAKKLKKVVKAVPLTSILLETDSPYLAPAPNRGKRNSSRNLPYVVAEIAQLKGVSEDEVLEQTEKNAREFYRF
ncbi:MAG: TatD family hydrolase [Hespellia sp.]|nr:TatD family hydrolase [Hespellia sp.]